MASLRVLQQLTRTNTRRLATEYSILRNRSQQIAVRNAHVAAITPRVQLVESNEVKRQRCEQKRFIWPFTRTGYCEMTYRQVNDLVIAKQSLILDVRRFDEVEEKGKIPHAEVLPVDEVEDAFSKLSPEEFEDKYGFKKPNKHDQIIVYCRSGRRAANAAYTLIHMGYDHVCRYEGSWLDWQKKYTG